MKTKEEIRDWLLENAVDELGDLMLIDLDFSEFDGDIFILGMIVKKDLMQTFQKVEGSLYQNYQTVKGDYYCLNNKVGGKIFEEPSTKLLKEVTLEELAELGYKLKE